ncbi:MAG: hypothetical protein ACT4OS_04880 [Acidimicrobiales bacterium]
MPMRIDCRHYESRTYASGETVRKCNLDLAPQAPWRCPEPCSAFTLRLGDVDWQYGELINPPLPPEPPGLDQGAADLLDAAEEIVNAAGPGILADLAADRASKRRPAGGWNSRAGRRAGGLGLSAWWERLNNRRRR